MKQKNTSKKELERIYKGGKVKMHSSKLVPVHMTVEELIAYNQLQRTPENPSGQYVDKETGLREYSRLSNILRVPEIRDLFIDTVDTLKEGGEIPPEINNMVSEYYETEKPELPPIPSDNEPMVQHYESAGENDDKKMAMFPLDVVHFLSILQGTDNPDPEFGLPQFGFIPKFISKPFESVVRVAATVAGGIVGFAAGGPGGAAAGAYAGNALGRMGTGQNIGSAMRAGLPNALYGGAAGLGASALGYTPANATSLINSGLTKVGLPSIASAAPALPGSTLAPAVAPAVAPAAADAGLFGGSMFEAAKPYLLPAAAMAGGMYLGKKGDEKKQKAYEQENRKAEDIMRSQRDYFNTKTPLELKSYPRIQEDQTFGRPRKHYKEDYYKEGGVVKEKSTKGIALKGPGDGQSDDIKQHIPEYTWIHDATTVSNLGNGTTEAGHKVLEKFEKKIEKELLPRYKEVLLEKIKKQGLRKVPCRVATGERETPPLLVGALGKGSFEKGAIELRKITKAIRMHKTSKRTELPPAALAMETYAKKALRGE